MSEWLRLEVGGAVHLYPLPSLPAWDDPDIKAALDAMDARARMIIALRERHGIPADWMDHPERGAPMRRTAAGHMLPHQGAGWDVAVIGGPVHPSLRAIATVHTASDMKGVVSDGQQS